MSSIPRVRKWHVKVMADNKLVLDKFFVWTISKRMVRIIVRMDHPWTWGKRLVISPAREEEVRG